VPSRNEAHSFSTNSQSFFWNLFRLCTIRLLKIGSDKNLLTMGLFEFVFCHENVVNIWLKTNTATFPCIDTAKPNDTT
jgi:hypothetical protein